MHRVLRQARPAGSTLAVQPWRRCWWATTCTSRMQASTVGRPLAWRGTCRSDRVTTVPVSLQQDCVSVSCFALYCPWLFKVPVHLYQ